MKLSEYNNIFGDIDLFLLDLLLKGNIQEGAEVLDAGCGAGRNTFFFLKHGFKVSAIDRLKSEVIVTNLMSRSLNKGDVAIKGDLDQLPYEEGSFDLIICSRVLHFAESKTKFNDMLSELYRVLKPSGLLYVSMNSQIGVDEKMDQSEKSVESRLFLNAGMIAEIEKKWHSIQEPRTVLFDLKHSETTLVLQKV